MTFNRRCLWIMIKFKQRLIDTDTEETLCNAVSDKITFPYTCLLSYISRGMYFYPDYGDWLAFLKDVTHLLLSSEYTNFYQILMWTYTRLVHLCIILCICFRLIFTQTPQDTQMTYLPYCRTSFNQYSLKYRRPSLWNNLPPSLQSTSTSS